MKISSLPWRSVLLAPFATVPAVALSCLGTSDAGMASDLQWGLVYGLYIGVPFAFVALVMIGLPSYYLLRRFNALRLWSVCAIGFVVPFSLFFTNLTSATTLGASLCGVAVAATAYLLRPAQSRHRSDTTASAG